MNDLLKLAIKGHGGYSVDILGGVGGALPVGVPRVRRGSVPTRRRDYVRNPDGSPVLDSVVVDITDVTFG